jgi:signal transduction histidine kinase
MKPRGWRLSALASATAAAVAVVLLLLAYAIAERAARGAGADARALGDLRRTFFGWSLVVVPLVAIGGRAFGRRMAHDLAGVRRRLLQRAYGDSAPPGLESHFTELQELEQAAERVWMEAARRAAGAELQRSTLAALVDSVSEGLLRVDGGGRIVYANPECRALLELLPSALGQAYAVVVRHKELRQVIQRALEGEAVSGVELAFGERRVLVSARTIPVPSHEGGAGVVLALADLTALRRLEGVRRDFVANVSHELKTPLTSIRGYSETLLQDDVPPDVQRQFLRVIHDNATRLQDIVDDLLDLSRIESGGWRPEPQDVNASELVRDVWTGCRDRAQQRAIRFSAPDRPHRVRADPAALRQVLSNLFDNALRYTPRDGSIEVSISTAPARPGGTRDGWVQVEVRDTGSGIPGDALPRIFERFYRVDPARSRAEGGTGLGLSIVKHLVESMGGEVSAKSELGKGTTISFTLPAAS